MRYKLKEKDNIIYVLEEDKAIAKYIIDRHWEEKNVSLKDDGLHIRLYNRTKKYIDCIVKLNEDNIQKIPE